MANNSPGSAGLPTCSSIPVSRQAGASPLKALAVDGAACTEADIASGAYTLVRPIFLLTRGEPAGASRDFLAYILSADGQETIRRNGLLPAR